MRTMPVNAVPYLHQVAAFETAMRCPDCALLMEQGTGKTLVTVAALGARYMDEGLQAAIVVCPVSVMPVWKREFDEFADYPVEVLLLERGAERSKKEIREFAMKPTGALKVYVVSYQSMWRIGLEGWAPVVPSLVGPKGTAWRSPVAIVCDESHKIKNGRAKQSKFLHLVGRFVRWRFLLTGTPITQSPLDVWSQYHFVKPGLFSPYFLTFRGRYAEMGGYEKKEVVAYHHLDELADKVHSISYRVTKREALDLPDMVFQDRYCVMPGPALSLYRKVVREELAQVEMGEVNPANILTRLLRLSQITGGHVTDEDGRRHELHHAKVDELMDIIEETQGKLVVFVRFLPEIEAIRNALDAVGIKYECLHGGVPTSQRGELVERFQKDPLRKVFVAQLQAAGLGITLTAASTAVFFSLNYSYADYEQCCARIHRIGQEEKCTFIHLLAKDTIDEDIVAVLKRKGTMAQLVVDDWKQMLKR